MEPVLVVPGGRTKRRCSLALADARLWLHRRINQAGVDALSTVVTKMWSAAVRAELGPAAGARFPCGTGPTEADVAAIGRTMPVILQVFGAASHPRSLRVPSFSLRVPFTSTALARSCV